MGALPVAPVTGITVALLGRGGERRYGRAWQDAVAGLPPAQRDQASELAVLLSTRRRLRRQATALAKGRRLMVIWHALHVPLAVALFLSAFVHAVAALYFS
jgi:hypothetical protein